MSHKQVFPWARGCFTGQVGKWGSLGQRCVKISLQPLQFSPSYNSHPPGLSIGTRNEKKTFVIRFLWIQINSSAAKPEIAIVSFLLTVYFKRLKPLISLLRI